MSINAWGLLAYTLHAGFSFVYWDTYDKYDKRWFFLSSIFGITNLMFVLGGF